MEGFYFKLNVEEYKFNMNLKDDKDIRTLKLKINQPVSHLLENPEEDIVSFNGHKTYVSTLFRVSAFDNHRLQKKHTKELPALKRWIQVRLKIWLSFYAEEKLSPELLEEYNELVKIFG